jgi:hypothetical protein
MSNNSARASQSQSSAQGTSEQGACPLCSDINSKQMINCMSCGARLPWADAATAQMQGARQSAVSPAAVPPKAPKLPASQTVGKVQFGDFQDVRQEETKLEKVGEFLIVAFGLIVVVTLVYFVWFRALGGTAGRGLTFIPMGLLARFIVNKIVGD